MRNGYIVDLSASVDFQESKKLEEEWLKYIKALFIEKSSKYHHLEKL